MRSGRFIGVMSGTSLDGIDVVLATITENMVAQQASLTWPIPHAIKEEILAICQGHKFSNIIIFLNAWCVTKFSTLLFEIGALGYKFTLYRLIINIPGIIVMGYIIDLLVNKKPHKI